MTTFINQNQKNNHKIVEMTLIKFQVFPIATILITIKINYLLKLAIIILTITPIFKTIFMMKPNQKWNLMERCPQKM